MIFLDSNVPMYLVGAAHPHKEDARRLLESAVARQEPLVTDAEVLQEILHRYHAIRRTEAIQPAFDLVLALVEDVLPVDVTTVRRAKDILAGSRMLSARDAVHLASMEAADVARIMSFDVGFDTWPGIERVGS